MNKGELLEMYQNDSMVKLKQNRMLFLEIGLACLFMVAILAGLERLEQVMPIELYVMAIVCSPASFLVALSFHQELKRLNK